MAITSSLIQTQWVRDAFKGAITPKIGAASSPDVLKVALFVQSTAVSQDTDAATYGVDGKMDGVLVLITATPPTLGLQQVEDVRNYFRLGWLVFEDEDANTDRLQWFGPDRAVYVPEAFASPANVVVSCKPGVSGTITPWVVTQ